MEDNENEAQGALIIDIPSTMAAEDATRLLNEQYRKGFYIHRALDRFDGARVFLVAAKAGIKSAPAQTAETRVMQFLRDNRELPVTQLCAGLKALKYPRSPQWVREKLGGIMSAERRLT